MDHPYVIAVVGGACAGSEIAAELVKAGQEVIVIEQNPLPYGKIEDGLPRWHVKLQKKECNAIDAKLDNPKIHFIPNCKLGVDLDLDELTDVWGVSMVVMASGAWRDRPLQAKGADGVLDGSLVYQNALVYWFNHYHEPNYQGPTFNLPPSPVIIGGGLASIDVAKICQFEQVRNALLARGYEADIVEMEHYGIAKVAEKAGFSLEDLNLTPARLFYRKRVIDMPLVPLPEDPPPEKLAKAELVRTKLINNATSRYGFEVHPLRATEEIHTENGKITGVTFRINTFQDGRFVDTGERERVATNMVISSIGSIPQPIKDIPMDGELYSWEDRYTGQLSGRPGIYCVGNAITGKGNIKDSAKNARRLGAVISAGLDGLEPDYAALFATRQNEAREHVNRLLSYISQMPAPDPTHRAILFQRVMELQADRGYNGDYGAWRDHVLEQRWRT